MNLLAAVVLLLVQAEAAPARAKAADARDRAAGRLAHVQGVRSVGMGGSGAKYLLMVVVEDEASKLRARTALGGNSFDGLDVLWTVSRPAPPAGAPVASVPAAAVPVAPAAPPSTTYPAADNPWGARADDCDIIRDHLGLKKISHPAGNGRSWVPCQVIFRSVIGPGGGHSLTYTKHRPNCPIRMGRVGMPPVSDRFMAWVFRSGITPPIRAGFLWPTELRASDSLWVRQAWGDYEARLPYIRSGGPSVPAPWTATR